MLELAIRPFTTFFATIGPVDVAALFAVLSASAGAKQRRSMAVKGTLIAAVLLFVAAFQHHPHHDTTPSGSQKKPED